MYEANQIKLLNNNIAMLRKQITDNHADISRLRKTREKIIAAQEKLRKTQSLIHQPELSKETWQGSHADDFLKIRDSIKQEFKSIHDLQVEVLTDNIYIKTYQLETLNKTYEDKIREKESEINFYQN